MINGPQVSFITICYNGFKDTCELIESLQNKIHSVSYEIIVVDNASREDEAVKIQALYPSVTTIRSDENKGFSGGNNLGIKAARGQYLFLINNDTYIESDGIAYLIERLESHPEIGAWCGHDHKTRSHRESRNDAGNLLPLLRRDRLEHQYVKSRL